MGLINMLTPGAKQRFTDKLNDLLRYVHEDRDREMIMYYTAELMTMVTNQFAYYDPKKHGFLKAKNTKKNKTRR